MTAGTGDSVLYATTSDGWRIALSRYLARGAPRRFPVVLCHGLSSNRLTWDLAPEVSLARRLALRGFDVFCLELRGHGLSDRPGWFNGKSFGWTLADYLEKDVPAALELVRQDTGAAQAHFVGHSMGGIILLSRLSRDGEAGIRSGTTIGSSLDYSYSKSWFKAVLPFKWAGSLVPALPFGLFAKLAAPFAPLGLGSPLAKFNFEPSNIDGRTCRTFMQEGVHDVSTGVLLQLATAFDPGGLKSASGTPYLPGLARVSAPVLFIAADRDRQCPPDAARATYEACGSKGKRFVLFGTDANGGRPYGHVDLVVGRHAPAEVHPVIEDWLLEHDA